MIGHAGDRVRVVDGVGALLHRDGAEVFRGRAVDVLVAAAPHREPLRRDEVSVRGGELAFARRQHAVHRLAVAGARAQDAVHDHDIGLPGDDRGGRTGDHRRDRVAAAHHALAPAEVVDADRVRDLHRRRRVATGVTGEAVDVARCEAAVAQRVARSFAGHAERGAARLPDERGSPDPHDRRVTQRASCHRRPPVRRDRLVSRLPRPIRAVPGPDVGYIVFG